MGLGGRGGRGKGEGGLAWPGVVIFILVLKRRGILIYLLAAVGRAPLISVGISS